MGEVESLKKENQQLRKELAELRQIIKEKSDNQKTGMVSKASRGILMSRAPFGYNIVEGKLIPAQNYKEIEEIFETFLHENLSLRQLASKHNLSVNGLKKILRNFTYIGKIKFNSEIFPGIHKPLISITLFNHVQDKLERLRIK